MIRILKLIYHFFKLRGQKAKLFFSVNWIKTIYFNFKMLPFKQAKQFPIIFYGPVKFYKLTGEVLIKAPIRMGMIGFGQKFEMQTVDKGIAELNISGKLVFNGHTHIGKDFFLYVGTKAYCEFGFMSRLGSNVKVICTNNVVIGNWTNIGYESQLSDSNYHPIKNTLTGKHYPTSKAIKLGDYNYFSNRISIMGGTRTSNNYVIASNSVCNKDYTALGENILIGGLPAKLIKENYSRDWEYEKERLFKNLIKWQSYDEFL